MAKKSSVFDYTFVPFDQFDIDQPVVQLIEMNDGYQVLLAGVAASMIKDSDTQDDLGGIHRNGFASFREFLLKEYDAKISADEPIFEIYSNNQVVNVGLNGLIAWLGSEDCDTFLEQKVMVASKITGRYRNPESLFMKLWEGDKDNE
jgi:hypothetical protein